VAIYCPEEAPNSGSDSDALADFRFYAGKARDEFNARGIQFEEIYAHSFHVRIGSEMRTFDTRKVGVGYYLVTPGKKPRIESGVMTDSDLLEVGSEYFGISLR
jgi:hypothetical protein